MSDLDSAFVSHGGKVSTAHKWSVVFGWLTISVVSMLLVLHQLARYLVPAFFCEGQTSCDYITVVVYKLCFYGIILGLLLLLPQNLKLSAVSILFVLAIVEVGFRMYESYLNYQYPQDEKDGGAALPTYDAMLGWKMTPNVEVHFADKANRIRTKVTTNSKGLRDEEYQYAKPQDTTRILLLGDSVIAGLEVENNQVLDKRLELWLSQHGKYEVVNAGVRGYGTDQSLLFFQNEGYKYHPDIVIYVFVNNDPMENATIRKPNRKYGKGYFKRVGNDLVLNGIPVPQSFEGEKDRWLMSDPLLEDAYNNHNNDDAGNASRAISFVRVAGQEVLRADVIKHLLDSVRFGTLRAWLMSLGIVDPPRRAYPEQYGWPHAHPKPQFVDDYEWGITEGLIVKMNQFSEAIDAKLVVYEFSSLGKQNAEITRLQSISTKAGISYFNSFKEMFEASHGTRKFCFPFDDHWNAMGHDFVASVMYKHLLQNGFLQ